MPPSTGLQGVRFTAQNDTLVRARTWNILEHLECLGFCTIGYEHSEHYEHYDLSTCATSTRHARRRARTRTLRPDARTHARTPDCNSTCEFFHHLAPLLPSVRTQRCWAECLDKQRVPDGADLKLCRHIQLPCVRRCLLPSMAVLQCCHRCSHWWRCNVPSVGGVARKQKTENSKGC